LKVSHDIASKKGLLGKITDARRVRARRVHLLERRSKDSEVRLKWHEYAGKSNCP